ncbi:AI-2E family transporter [Hominifimenecus sp. rT4P-3]|uniref:AI-2E family transporter n=1 Tax=Hominifimenecus sp. rT4P-3 TaxID=3242979 RepID=UPI003DA5D6B7
MEFNRKTIRVLMGLISFAIVLYVSLQNLGAVARGLSWLLGVFSPLFIGFAIAFVLNVPLLTLEERVFPTLPWKDNRIFQRIQRVLAIVLSVFLLFGLLLLLLFLILPQLKSSALSLAQVLPGYLKDFQEFAISFLGRWGISLESLNHLTLDAGKLEELVTTFFSRGDASFADAIGGAVNLAATVIHSFVNIVFGFTFAMYILYSKETLSYQTKKILLAVLPEHVVERIFSLSTLSYEVFSRFVSGQCIEAVIIGLLCYLGMLLFSFPYALMISALVGFTALIPVIGAFLGTAVGVLLIFMESPVKAFWFVIFIMVLQQLEGDLIYPRVVGKSIGLPSLWVLAAITIGGSTGGILGMLLGVPLCSVLYCLMREAVNGKLKEKITPEETENS